MRRLIKSRDYLKRCLGFLLIFGFISLGAIGGCNNNGGGPVTPAVEDVGPVSTAVDVDPDSIVGIAIAVDDVGNLVVVDSFLKAVVQVDPKTGLRTTISDNQMMDMEPYFEDPRGIAVEGDIAGDGYIWVLDSDAVIQVNYKTGARTIISDNQMMDMSDNQMMDMEPYFDFEDPRGIAVDGDDNLVVVDSGLKAVVEVNRETGNRTTISHNQDRGTDFQIPLGVAVDGDDNLVVVDSGLKAVVEVNRDTGERTTISDNQMMDMEPYFEDPRGIAVEGDIAVDGYIWVLDSDAVIQVNYETGARTIISMIISRPADGMDMGDGVGPAFEDPLGIAVEDEGSLVVVDSALDRVIRVDRDGGDRSRIPISIYISEDVGPDSTAVDDSTGMGP